MPVGPRRLGALVSRVAKRSAGRRGLPTAEILTNWRSIVGPELAPLTVPERVTFPRGAGDGGTLKIRVAAGFGPVVAQQAPRILARINTYFGYAAIARVRLVQGLPLPEAPAPFGEAGAAKSGEADPGGVPETAPADSPERESDPIPALRRLQAALAARSRQRGGSGGTS